MSRGEIKSSYCLLLDTGSLAGDFISEKAVTSFNFTATHTDSKLNNTCHTLNTKVDLGVTFHNELLDNNDTFDISPIILKETPVDMIIGRDTIKKYKLFKKIPSQLSSDGLNHDDLKVDEVGLQSVSLFGLSEMVT